MLETNWQSLAVKRPCLRSHISLHPQRYRGQPWYVLHDSLTGRHTRLNAAAYAFVGRLNGNHTIEQIYSTLTGGDAGDSATNGTTSAGLSQQEISTLLFQLQQMGALAPGAEQGFERDTDALSEEHDYQVALRRKRRWSTPLAIRIPLFDPDAFLNRLTPHLLPWLGRSAVVLWCLLMGVAVVSAVAHAGELVREFARVTRSPGYLMLLWFAYPLLKTVHEFAHAICLKRGGGEVHEMGITLLLLTPVPYVDASAAWLLHSRFQRALVGAAGIFAEVTMAAVALLLWISVEPGFTRDLSFAVLTVGSLSTLLFNANPLLKFDGYYVLQDLIEIPNLYGRSQRYYIYLVKRYVLSVVDAESPVSAQGERAWFVCYGALAFIYRSVILLTIGLWLIGKFLIVGVLLTLWVLMQQFLLPSIAAGIYLVSSPELEHRRVQRASLPGLMIIGVLLFLALVPVPHSTRAEGIVWVPDQAQLYASSAGLVAEVYVQPGTFVVPGDPVLRLEQPYVDAQVRILEARIQEHRIREAAERISGSYQSDITAEDIAVLVSELSEYQRQQRELVVTARSSGTFTIGDNLRLSGRYFSQGDLIGHVVNPSQLVVRVVIPESEIGPVQGGILAVTVRLAERFGEIIPATLARETPSADNRLPSAALGTEGGGGIPVAGSDYRANNRSHNRVENRADTESDWSGNPGTQALDTLKSVFHFEFRLPAEVHVSGVGERAYVKLRHPAEPLAKRWLDSTRKLFLSQLPGIPA